MREATCSPWPVTVVTWNIHGAVGHDGRFDPSRIATVLREMNPDIIALQEVPLGGRDWPNVLQGLERTLGRVGVAGPTFDVGGRRFGNAILSRYPILQTRRIDISFGSHEPRGALDADIYCHGYRLRVVATHLGLRASERTAQVRRLLQHFDTADMPVMLMGDLNEWFVWGKPLRQLVSHFQSVPAPATFPSVCPLLALDRIWIRPRHRLVRVRVHRSPLARAASDHLPLLAAISG